MLTYKAMYKFVGSEVHAEVLDFPGVITSGRDIDDARTSLAGALVDMAETALELGETLPMPNPQLSDAEADLEEPIHLILNASAKINFVAEPAYEAA